MRLDIYQTETERLAKIQNAMLNMAREKLDAGQALNDLEQSGVLHALQILIENAIGKSKHLLKASGQPVPVSAYESFSALVKIRVLSNEELSRWNAVIGIRNRIVHDYMNVDLKVVFSIIQSGQYGFITDFLLRPISVVSDT